MDKLVAREQMAYDTAEKMAALRERRIVEAIDEYYGHHNWTEDEVTKIANMTVHADGTETLSLNGRPVLKFYPIQTETVINERSAVCTFTQACKRLI